MMPSVSVFADVVIDIPMASQRDLNVALSMGLGEAWHFSMMKCNEHRAAPLNVSQCVDWNEMSTGGNDSRSQLQNKSSGDNQYLNKLSIKSGNEGKNTCITERNLSSDVENLGYELGDRIKLVDSINNVDDKACHINLDIDTEVDVSTPCSVMCAGEGVCTVGRLSVMQHPQSPASSTRYSNFNTDSLAPSLDYHQGPRVSNTNINSAMFRNKRLAAFLYKQLSPRFSRCHKQWVSPLDTLTSVPDSVDVSEAPITPRLSLSRSGNTSIVLDSVGIQPHDNMTSHQLAIPSPARILLSSVEDFITPAGGLSYKQDGLVPSSGRSISSTACRVSAAGWKRVRRLLAVTVLLIALLATPVSGRYDRGGQQHSITWGRANSHSSAVFGNVPSNVTAVLGHRARLPCQVKNLGLKDVSWIRQRDLHILTVGIFTYTSDDRFKVFHPPETEDWFLDIISVTFRDAGIYECQVSTSPKVSLPIHLTVLAVQEADILGPREVYIQHGSTISLHCEVQAGVEVVGPVRWLRGSSTLNYSSPRGGISMEVEKTPTMTTSKLYMTRAVKADSGNYTCAPMYALPDSVIVHVVNAGEESAAAVQSRMAVLRAGVGVVWACVGLVWITTVLAASLMSASPPT